MIEDDLSFASFYLTVDLFSEEIEVGADHPTLQSVLNTKSIGLAPCHLPSDLIEIYPIVKLPYGVACRVIRLRLFRSSVGTLCCSVSPVIEALFLEIAGLFTIGGPSSRWFWSYGDSMVTPPFVFHKGSSLNGHA
ncbi:hypothetical protein Bca4012_045101 [Brassica carinata]